VSDEYIKQIIWGSVGLIVLICIAFLLDYSRLQDWAEYIYIFFIFLLLITLFIGKVVHGAKSWIPFFVFGIQPSEFAKISTILLLAKHLARNEERVQRITEFLKGLGIVLFPVFLILMQPDLGTALVYIPIFLIMTYVAGCKKRHILFFLLTGIPLIILSVLPAWENYMNGKKIPFSSIFIETDLVKYTISALVLILALALLGYYVFKKKYYYWIVYSVSILVFSITGSMGARFLLKEYQIMRLIVFLNPGVDPRGAGWNIIQSITAVGSGGLFGKGFLQGTQSQYRFLPQQSTDFIFSIIAEEWGFIGGMLVFTLFLIIMLRGLAIILSTKDPFAIYTGAGIIGMIFFHFIVNIGMTMGIMPITGIPLFFLSYGGSSLWTALIGIGILLNINMRKYR